MRVLRTFALLAFLAVPAVAPVGALAAEGDAEALTAANEMFAAISGEMLHDLTTQMTGAIWPQVERMIAGKKIDDATLAEMRQEFERIQLENLTEIMKLAPPIYARHFTAEELREIAAFYRTPVGAKALKELPQVMGEFFREMGPTLQTVATDTEDAMTHILKAHGYEE